ncbi:hypothetical protein PspLS_04138 [Pyricularia sp. CBS 133598]|nr:hypothetical protein PspLS_04138 [Pyricularia sp. CBS 133598]
MPLRNYPYCLLQEGSRSGKLPNDSTLNNVPQFITMYCTIFAIYQEQPGTGCDWHQREDTPGLCRLPPAGSRTIATMVTSVITICRDNALSTDNR